MSEKTFFGTLDFRNAKYQGAIKNTLPDGLALLLDYQHLFAVSNFKTDTLYGPTLIVFPNGDYLFGKIKRNALDWICVYAKATGQTYVFNFNNGESNKIAYSDNNNIVIELFSKDATLKIGETTALKEKHSNKWNLISQILGIEVPQYMQNYKSYVKETFQRDFSDVFDCNESSGLTFIGFKDSPSLGVKFSKEDKVQQVGYFDQFPRNMEFGKKYLESVSTKIKVEQGRFKQPEKIFTYQQKRPPQAIKYSEEFFKRGTNFKNSFFKVPLIQEIATYLSKIQKQVNSLQFVQFGQKILEQPEGQTEEQPEYKNKEYTIQQVKKEIYAALKRRNKGNYRKESLSRQKLKVSGQQHLQYFPAKREGISQNQPEDARSLSKKNRFVYYQNQNTAGQVPNGQAYVQMSQKRQQRLEHGLKLDYKLYSEQKDPTQFKVITPTHQRKYNFQAAFQQEKARQQALLQIRRNISPLKQRPTGIRNYSPYKAQQVKAVGRQHNLVTPQTNHFTLGNNPGRDQNQTVGNYLNYKNRNKTPPSHSPFKDEVYQKTGAQFSQKLLADRTSFETGLTPDKSKRDPTLPFRHKKNFKYV